MSAVPQPRNLQLELLIKLLKMTTSPVDGEALLAARKANEQIAKMGVDWDDLLRGKVTVMADPFMTLKEPPKPQAQGTYTAPPRSTQPPPARPAPPAPPPPPPPPPRFGSFRANQYGGRCPNCSTWVDPAMGFTRQNLNTQKWVVSCQMDDSCSTSVAQRARSAAAAPPPKPAPPRSGKVKFGSVNLDNLMDKIQ